MILLVNADRLFKILLANYGVGYEGTRIQVGYKTRDAQEHERHEARGARDK